MRILLVSNFSTSACRTGAEWRSHWLRQALEQLGAVDVVELTNAKLTREIHWYDIWTLPIRKFAPLCTFPWYCEDFKRKYIGENIYDAIVVRYSAVAAYIGAWKLGRSCFVDIDDLPIQLCQSSWQRPIVRWWQQWLYLKCTGCWVANREQVQFVNGFSNCIELPNIANAPDVATNTDGQSKVILTVGSLAHSPNVHGISKFIEECWPAIRSNCTNAEYWIAGGGCPDEVANKWRQAPGVKVLGFVKELSTVYTSAKGVVCPVYEGGGTCIKSVEALMYGRVVMGPHFAFRGWTDEQKAQQFVFSGESKAIVKYCLAILQSNSFYQRFSPQDIQSWAKKNFGMEMFVEQVKKLMKGSMHEA